MFITVGLGGATVRFTGAWTRRLSLPVSEPRLRNHTRCLGCADLGKQTWEKIWKSLLRVHDLCFEKHRSGDVFRYREGRYQSFTPCLCKYVK